MIIGRAFAASGLRNVRLLVLTWCLLGLLPCPGASLQIYDLKCDFQTDPMGIDTLKPSLSWKLDSAQRGQSQTACQIVAASTLVKLRKGQFDLWDSGKVNSSQSVGVPYGGASLHSRERVYWSVRAWDREGQICACRQPASWETGLIKPEDWQAVWITPPPGESLPENKMFDNNPAPLPASLEASATGPRSRGPERHTRSHLCQRPRLLRIISKWRACRRSHA